MSAANGLNFVGEYWIDAWQRSILALDVLRERGNIYLEHSAQNAPHVLTFKAELVLDGRTLKRPVNYVLARIVPDVAVAADPTKRPFIVVDPRAGHGPGIGGMKQDSEVGVALAAGHPCYFVGFLPNPVPGQTIEDVCSAEAAFIEEVARLHPHAEGKPAIVANCQAGWQIMMMAALRPEIVGPLVLAGSPLSYWAGVRGKNPLRYLGGLLGGTWLTALAGDMGAGIFDGAHLVANFESLNPANTYWEKAYGVYSRIDTEAKRFLDFETWWGSPVLLNAEEMQWIADNLFVGNKLSSGGIHASNGLRVDLRNIKSPIVVLCSWGDNITPPQQALGWITDLYDDEREIVENGQTIVYTTHQSIGHLGIFVSGKVATREHAEFANCMDLIDLLPPGLYEAVISEVDQDTENPELIHGKYLFRLEPRTLDDIRAFGNNDEADELRFATAARLSEVNLGLYRTLAQPAVRALVSQQSGETLRAVHPNRQRFAMFADRNPAMPPVKALAEQVRANRRPVSADNPLLAMEQAASTWISTWLDSYRIARDGMTEAFFVNLYGSPMLQAMMGLGTDGKHSTRHNERDLTRETSAANARAGLDKLYETGGILEAIVRSLIYVRRDEGRIDERGFSMLQAIRAARPAANRLSLAEIKQLFRTQFLLIYQDEKRALATMPTLLARQPEGRKEALEIVHQVVEASGRPGADAARRLEEIDLLFDSKSRAQPSNEAAHARRGASP
jgi:pimeloyl-ACP methyl ester carboxylesterase